MSMSEGSRSRSGAVFHLDADEASVTEGQFEVRQTWGPLSDLVGRVKVVVTNRRLIFWSFRNSRGLEHPLFLGLDT